MDKADRLINLFDEVERGGYGVMLMVRSGEMFARTLRWVRIDCVGGNVPFFVRLLCGCVVQKAGAGAGGVLPAYRRRWMEGKIVLLDGSSGYDVFRVWLERLHEAFCDLGVEALIVPSRMEEDLTPGERDVTLGFNLIRQWSPRTAQRRHVVWMVDPPPYHGHFFAHELSGMPVDPAQCLVGCADRNWMSFAQRVYGYDNVFFLPHAGSVRDVTEPDEGKRDFDALFLGSLQLPERIVELLDQQAGTHAPLLHELIERMDAAGGGISLEQALPNLASALGLPREKRWIFINVYFPLLDRYFRNRDRIRMISALGRSGSRVDVFGSGDWSAVPWPEGVILHDALPFADSFDLMRKAKVVVNHAPSHRGGAHERIFDALLCGAAVLTTPSSYVQEIFSSAQGVRMPRPEEHPGDALMQMLADASRIESIRAGRAMVDAGHLMKHRAGQLLAAL